MFSLRLKSRSGLIIAGEAAIEFDIDVEVKFGRDLDELGYGLMCRM